jgi:hypothetical protein
MVLVTNQRRMGCCYGQRDILVQLTALVWTLSARSKTSKTKRKSRKSPAAYAKTQIVDRFGQEDTDIA